MKNTLLCFCITAVLILSAAVLVDTASCYHSPSATAPQLPTSARDAADAGAFRVIADAYAFILSIRNSVASGKLTLTPTEKAAFNDLVQSYDVAYATGLAYHAGASTDVGALNNATNTLSAKLTTASAQIASGK